MNQNRAFLLFAWVAVAILLAFEWTRYTATPAPVAAPVAAPAAAVAPGTLPGADALPSPAAAPSTPALAPASPALPASALPGAAVPTPEVAAPAPAIADAGQREVLTDVLRLRIDARGGALVFAELLDYPVDQENPERGNVVLLSPEAATLDVAQTGWISSSPAPGLDAIYAFEGGDAPLVLADGQDALVVPLLWTDPATGLSVRKTYTVRRGSYAIGVRHEVVNAGTAAFTGHLMQQLRRVPPPPPAKHAMFTNPESFSFVGAAWYSSEDHFEKRKFADFVEDGPLNKDVTGGWIAMLQHHFLSAWVPPEGEAHRYSLDAQGDQYAIRSVGQATTVAPGGRAAVEATLWVGPKLQAPMQQVASSLPLSLDYGIFSFLAQPLFWVLNWLHGLFGNWGWAIVGIVVILKLLLYPVSAKQYQSMARMRAVAPRIEQLKERYGEDRMKFNQAMMELYQKEKINPLGGCLPMLVPIPIFLALYWVLLESVELRQAPWVLWIDNLTAPDPLFILPALNLVVMWLTQKLTPSPGMDPTQKKILQWMPVVFGVMFAFFPSGLVLYWLTNGLLGLAQQWWMTKRYGGPTAGAPAVVKAK
jgi:YidC/Oxa1 family membrane protein insertase